MRESGTNKSDDSSQQACSSSGLRIGGMCLNWKVIGGLAAVGLGIWAVAPNLVSGVVPLLVVAACPLSMILMMRGMSGGQQARSNDDSDASRRVHAPTESGERRDLATLKAEHARLTAELEALQSDAARSRTAPSGSPNGSTNPSTAPASGSRSADGDVT
jgi:hypothetical protein